MAFLRQEEEWIPCSDWGRQQKLRNEEYMRELAIAKRQAKSEAKPKRIRVRVAVCREYGKCGCGAALGPQNKSGVCAKCFSKHRTVLQTPRKPCPECGSLMARNNRTGVCSKCAAKASPKLCACGNRLGNRNTSGICKDCAVAALPAKRYCARCENILHPTNKTGLCNLHGNAAKQQAYLARKRAA